MVQEQLSTFTTDFKTISTSLSQMMTQQSSPSESSMLLQEDNDVLALKQHIFEPEEVNRIQQEKIEELRIELTRLNDSTEGYEERIRQLSSDVEGASKLKNRLVVIEEELEEKKRLLSEANEELNRVQDIQEEVVSEEVMSLQIKLNSIQEELEKKHKLIENKTIEWRDLQHVLSDEIRSLEMRNSAMNEENLILQTKIAKLEETVSNYSASESMRISITDENTSLQSNLEETKILLSQREQTLNDEREAFKMKVESLEWSIQERIIENASMRETLKGITNELQIVQNQLRNVEEEKSSLANRLNEAIRDSEKRSRATEAEIRQLSQNIKELNEMLNEKAAQLAAATEELDSYKNTSIQKSQHEEKVKELNKALADMTQKVKESEIMYQRIEEKKKRDLESLRKQNELMNTLQREKCEIERAMNEKLEIVELELSQHKQVVEEMKRDIDHLVHDKSELQQQLADTKAMAENAAKLRIESNNNNKLGLEDTKPKPSTSPEVESDGQSSSAGEESVSSFVVIETRQEKHKASDDRKLQVL